MNSDVACRKEWIQLTALELQVPLFSQVFSFKECVIGVHGALPEDNSLRSFRP